MMEIWCKSISESVYRHTRRGENDTDRIVLHTGRNMTDAVQVLVRDSMRGFTVEGFSIDGVPDKMTVTGGAQGYESYSDGLPYPDRLTGAACTAVQANATQGYVFVIGTAADAVCGTYPICVTLHIRYADETELSLHAYICVTIHKAAIGEPKDSAFGHEYFFDMKGGDETLVSYARAMKELRVNSLYVNAIPLLCQSGSKRTGEKAWALDFSAFDHFIKLFLSNGSFRYLTVTGVIRPVDGAVITAIDENGNACGMELFTENADMECAGAWAETFFGGIYMHCRDMGWEKMLRFHLEDEPHTTQSWLWAREICHRAAPGVPCAEPIDTMGIGRAFGTECDIPVPRLEVFDHDAAYYAEHIGNGREVWCYSCCYPEEPWWLNQFIDLPARYARLIKWACFSQDITGFLHWGFNFWSRESLYGMNPEARFKGDGFIVYPDEAHHGVVMSNRGLASAMGIEEWELLHMLAGRDRQAAKAFARRVARTFRDFSDDPKVLDSTRAELLAVLDTL